MPTVSPNTLLLKAVWVIYSSNISLPTILCYQLMRNGGVLSCRNFSKYAIASYKSYNKLLLKAGVPIEHLRNHPTHSSEFHFEKKAQN